jgi:hypothetical protein
MSSEVMASLSLIPDSVELVNRVTCFCNGQIFDTLIIRVDPNHFKEQLSIAVQLAFLNATEMSPQSSFEERRAALFSEVQVDNIGPKILSQH